ncbi:MAG: BrnT family toxin [Acidobacteria bacterium]|nr:BrnT family toxin [Acidobacteriota bacterium]
MRFTWDPDKSDANLAARGFDFEFATLIFAGPTLEQEDRRRDYGERRVIAIGLAQGIALTVVYTDRTTEADLERRIISARRSNRRERKAYQVALERG